MTKQTMANGAITNFTYNALSQMAGLSNLSSSGAILSKFGHETTASQKLLYDAAGNLKREIAGFSATAFRGTTNYTYDNKDQLTQESSTRNGGFTNVFGYDAMGNPTSWKGQARTFNLNNQETTGGPYQFAYDGNGNPTTYKGSSFVFDENDKLTRITTSGTVLMQAGYRDDGLRAWKNTANGTTYFLYDGDQLVCEFDGNGTLKNTNVWGANGLLARQSGATLAYFVWDNRGNIAQKLNANGTVATNFNVTSWGDVTRDVQSSDAYFGLGGQFGNYFDVETGLLLCGQRYYDSAAGRWIGRDPIEYDGGLNLYGYVENNPTNFVDPDGEAPAKIYPTIKIFPTPDAAAVAALREAYPLSEVDNLSLAQKTKDREYYGSIIRLPGKTKRYIYTPPTKWLSTAISAPFFAPTAGVVAQYHTHCDTGPTPYGNYDEYYSSSDLKNSNKYKLPEYIGTKTSIRKYNPLYRKRYKRYKFFHGRLVLMKGEYVAPRIPPTRKR